MNKIPNRIKELRKQKGVTLKRFPSLAEAIDYKEVVLNQLDKDVRQKQVKK
ncbi:TPA: hypothetical protein ACJ66F_001826 [Streptococcus pyogenes]